MILRAARACLRAMPAPIITLRICFRHCWRLLLFAADYADHFSARHICHAIIFIAFLRRLSPYGHIVFFFFFFFFASPLLFSFRHY